MFRLLQFKEVNCPNDCEVYLCSDKILLSILRVETECVRRKLDCQYCHITIEYQSIEVEHNLHKEQCPKLPLPCPNKCDVDNIPLEEMNGTEKFVYLKKLIASTNVENLNCKKT